MKKNITTFIFIFTVSLVSISCSSDDEPQEIPKHISYNKEIMVELNKFRAKYGKKKLIPSSDIIKTQTDNHTDYMIRKGDISHDLFNSERIPYIKKELKSNSHAENVAYNYSTKAIDVIIQWSESTGHREAMLGDFTYFYVTAKKEIDGKKWYYTAIFAKVR